MTPVVVGTVYDGVVAAPFAQADCVVDGETALAGVSGVTGGMTTGTRVRTVATLLTALADGATASARIRAFKLNCPSTIGGADFASRTVATFVLSRPSAGE